MPFILVVIILIMITYPLVGFPLLILAFVIDYFFGIMPDSTDKQSTTTQPDSLEDITNIYRDKLSVLDQLTTTTDTPSSTQESIAPTIIQPQPLTYNQYMSSTDKAKHLLTQYWKDLKAKRIHVFGNKCEACGCTGPLELHHVTYVRLGAEQLDDVRLTCRSCHQSTHDEYGYDRDTLYPLILKD